MGTYQPSDFDRRVYDAAVCAIGDRAPGSPFATDFDVTAHLKEPSLDRRLVRHSLRALGADYLDVKVREPGDYEVQAIHNPLP